MANASNHYLLILCGGTGPRLWPLSRTDYPKQFLAILDHRSLLNNTVDRFRKFIPAKNIFIVSNQKYYRLLRLHLKNVIPSTNYILEPEKKNTAMAIIYAAAHIYHLNPNAIITATPSDHYISKLKNFHKNILSSVKIATATPDIIAIGIKPTKPDTSYGYLLTSASRHLGAYSVLKFHEKPSAIDASIYIKKGAYWNSGIYTFSLSSLSTELAKYDTNYHRLFEKLKSGPINSTLAEKIYKLSGNLPFDQVISEKTDRLAMITATFTWNDIGEWQTIYETLVHNSRGIATIGQETVFLNENSKNCLIHAPKNKLVGLVGVNGLAVIDTPDSLLVCNLNDSFSVRSLVAQIVDSPKLKHHFLSRYGR